MLDNYLKLFYLWEAK